MRHEASCTSAPYDACALANFLLDLASERGVGLTQIQVLKILYFANGWFLVCYNLPLVKQNFEAWEYGPVLRIVRDSFKTFGKAEITGRAEKLDLSTGEFVEVTYSLEPNHAKFVEQIFEAYHVHGAWELSDMTHEEGSPWDTIWNSKEPIGRLGLRISQDEIQKYFENLPRRFGAH